MTAPDSATFEDHLRTLETLVERLEKGDGTLDDALRDFQQGMALVERCKTALATAEVKVETILTAAQAGAP